MEKNWWLQIGKTGKTDSGLYFHALLVNKPIWRGKHKIIFLQACFVTQIVLLKIFELKSHFLRKPGRFGKSGYIIVTDSFEILTVIWVP